MDIKGYKCPNCGAAAAFTQQTAPVNAENRAQDTEPESAQAENPQPKPAENANFAPKIENHLIKAIIAAVCCCLPFGIVAIVYAAQVDPKFGAKDFAGAMEASKKANLWGNLAIGLGVLVYVIWAILYSTIFVAAFTEAFNAAGGSF